MITQATSEHLQLLNKQRHLPRERAPPTINARARKSLFDVVIPVVEHKIHDSAETKK